jgi:multicomponent Na+:H+ antiporter subunit C
MEFLLAIVIGILFAAGIYMLLRRSIVKLVLGLALISHATNLLIFTVGGLERGRPPLVAKGASTLAAPYADPLPQALILTAIVIGFGVTAFLVVLVKRAWQVAGADDLDELRTTE